LTVPVEDVVHAALAAVATDKARVIPGWKVALLMGVAVALPLDFAGDFAEESALRARPGVI